MARIDAHIVEPSEAEEMRDALAHVEHRQRIADARFDHLDERRLRGVAAVEHEPDGGNRLPEVVGDLRARGAAQRTQSTQNAERRAHATERPCIRAFCIRALATHQKVCLTRNSRA